MGLKFKTLVFLGLALILAVSLVAVACSGNGGTTADCSAVESQLAAEKAKTAQLQGQVSDLEDDLAALQKPAKVYRMEPATWIAAGTPWDFLNYMSEYLNTASNGRIVSTPSAPGAVCPVEEQIEAVASGSTIAMLATPSYYAGKFPMAALYNTSIGLNTSIDMINCYETFKDGIVSKTYYDQVESLYNVEIAGERIGGLDGIYSSKVNIPNVDAFSGLKFRCGDEHFAVPITSFGGSTVWFPGTEIYTNLATGVVDGFTYGSAYDHLGLGVQDVTSFWGPRNYPIAGANNEQFVINRDVWNEMAPDLQSLIKASIAGARDRSNAESYYWIADSWKKAVDAGITVVNWSAEDNARWVAAQMDWAEQYTNASAEAKLLMDTVAEYRAFMGQ